MKDRNQNSTKSIRNTLVRYSLSKNHRLILNDYYEAPVTKVTNETCNTQLNKLVENITGGNGTGKRLSGLIAMLMPITLTTAQVQQLLDESYFVVHIQAIENPQLSLTCQHL